MAESATDYTSGLIKIYLKKLKEIDEDIALVDVLEIPCTDIMNDNYKDHFQVIENTNVNNINSLKKEYF